MICAKRRLLVSASFFIRRRILLLGDEVLQGLQLLFRQLLNLFLQLFHPLSGRRLLRIRDRLTHTVLQLFVEHLSVPPSSPAHR